MSGNPKQTAGGGPQTQRFSSPQIFQPIQTGQRTDGYHPPPYVPSQQPNQPGTAGQTLRGLPTTGPPNQSSTPPTNDIKVQAVQPQQSMNPIYVGPQQQVRGAQGYFRQTGPASQSQRMPNQHRSQQQMYQPAATQFMPMPVQPMFVANQMQCFNGQRPQAFVQTMPAVFAGPSVNAAAPFSYSPNPNQPPTISYPFYPVAPARPGHPPQTTLQQNAAQQLHSLQMPPAQGAQVPYQHQQQQQQQQQQKQHKRRPNAIAIVDPTTGCDVLNEVFDKQNNNNSNNSNSSHPPSGESSARQTPQPAQQLHNSAHSKEVQAAFAKQVAQAISNDPNHHHSIEDTELHQHNHHQQQQHHHHHHHHHHHIGNNSNNNNNNNSNNNNGSGGGGGGGAVVVGGVIVGANSNNSEHLEQSQIYHQTTNSRLDHLVQSSNLKAQAKEFVLSTPNIARETTPIVSANCDAVEVTLPNKQAKDRESPAKGRKTTREQSQQQSTVSSTVVTITTPAAAATPSTIATTVKDGSSDKDIVNNKNDNTKQSSSDAVNVVVSTATIAATIASSTTTTVITTINSIQSSQTSPIVTNSNNNTNSSSVPVTIKEIKDDNKKIQRKDITTTVVATATTTTTTTAATTTKVPSTDNSDIVNNPTTIVQSAQSVQDGAGNAKSKNAAQRAKETQKQSQQQQKPPIQPTITIPQSQPAKPNNKSNKRSELNQKGANKEGTDMDAFNDNNIIIQQQQQQHMDVVNANINSNNNDLINANSVVDNTVTKTTTPAALTTVSTTSTTLTSNTVNNRNNVDTENEINQSKTCNNNEITTPTTTNNNNNNNINNKPENVTNTTKTLPKSKVDVTNIFGDQQKTSKIISSTITSTTVAPTSIQTNVEQSQDETDRISLTSNDKLIQAKNEANTKAISDNGTTLIETKSDLPYREGQWAPNNLDGKKVYDRDFLLSLRNNPASRQKPDNLPDIILADERGRMSDGRYSMGRSTDFTNPPFNNFGGKSASQRGKLPQRNSQSGKASTGGGGGGGGGKGSRSQVIKVSISVREDVKLHEVENAWKPARLAKSDNVSDEERKTEDLYRKVRGVLNKLTPQKFDTLVGQVRELQIDTTDRLQGVINLVFEKAVDEPNFSVAYALMCRELALMQVYDKEKETTVNFRKLLINQCQKEFEKQSFDESARLEKIKEINECTDPEKKKELQFELDESDRKIRMKSVGNIRFIGELFKQNMLTVNIMMRCLQNLLENKDEESLECLCKLLTTIGKELETQRKIDLTQIFTVMKELADKKHGKVSSRVRFMLQDVIDLRKNKWIPRRQDSNPKTIDQIQKEAESEQLNIQVMNSLPMTPNRKDDRPGGGSGGGSGGASGGSSNTNIGTGNSGLNTDRKRRNVSDDGWQTASRRSTQQFSVQSDKLKIKASATDEPFGSKQMFGNWSKGSNIKTEPTSTNTANIYAALENIDTEKRLPGLRPNSKDPYSSKGPSLERSSYNKQSYDGRGSSRSGSQQRSNNDNIPSTTLSSQQQSHHHQQQQQQKTAPAVLTSSSSLPPIANTSSSTSSTNATSAIKSAAVKQTSVNTLTEEQLDRRTKNNLEEYLNDSCTVEDYDQDTQASVPLPYLPKMVTNGYLHVLERSSTARLRTGKLFAKLILLRTLPLDAYCAGIEEVLNECDDLIIDIPMIWKYLAEILVHLITEDALPLTRLHKSCEVLIGQGHGAKFLAPLFKFVVMEKGPNFLQSCWQASGLSLTDFMSESEVDKFVKDNDLECLRGGGTSAGQCSLTYEQIHKKLLEFFRTNASFDDIVNWITANVGDRVTENKFIRTLATAIFENSIVRDKLQADTLKAHYKLLLKYVDNNPNYELQCLYALQALITKLEHPQGLLLGICNRLYEDSTFSQDCFIAWEQSDDPAEQKDKGVALKQLTSFFTSLKENEDEDDDGSSSSEEA